MALTSADKSRLNRHPAITEGRGLRVYVAGPYSAEDEDEKQSNVGRARDAGAEIYRRGHVPFIPHTMTCDFELLYPEITRGIYLETDLVWLGLCDAVFMLAYWEKSKGAREELRFARDHDKIIFWYIEDVPWLIRNRRDYVAQEV